MAEKSKIASRIGTASTAISMASTGLRLYTDYKQKWDAKRCYSLSLDEGSYVFIPIMNWLISNLPETRHAKLHSYSSAQYVSHNPGKVIRFKLKGYDLRMEPDDDKNQVQANQYGELDVRKRSVTFFCQSKGGIQALRGLLDELHEEKRIKGIELQGYNCNTYGWNSRPLPIRHLDTIFLQRGQKEALMSDIEEFYSSQEAYERIGAPWHRGYLLYGPPGNGKTSLVQGLAHYYKKNVYNLPLSVVNSDSQLLERLNNMEGGSFLLLEDVDIFKDSVNRESKGEKGPTLAGLLNAFDGINTPHGLVTFFTTNVKETLDPALIRPGRMDMHIELTPPVDEQIRDMFKAVYGEPLDVNPKQFSSMAEYADVLKRNIGNPESARLEIKNDA